MARPGKWYWNMGPQFGPLDGTYPPNIERMGVINDPAFDGSRYLQQNFVAEQPVFGENDARFVELSTTSNDFDEVSTRICLGNWPT